MRVQWLREDWSSCGGPSNVVGGVAVLWDGEKIQRAYLRWYVRTVKLIRWFDDQWWFRLYSVFVMWCGVWKLLELAGWL